ncbi:ADP-ribosyl cyclase/cyclic ADP-ribose hydrolase-like [Mercenaria mercenaria]|uniref:ADP-ribosyl cyclase/cyclic ADP-ribose hydrolase-like n=1 Tax=Mercenaria mercenaria TaxID=6596 RepID=UPI00234FA894|nr:ADP-ribosyl cyclase/cyclic ADP-ribose hydrolase-like [Mercenaria mercenaria]
MKIKTNSSAIVGGTTTLKKMFIFCSILLLAFVQTSTGFILEPYTDHDNCNRKHVTVAELRDIFLGRCVDFQTNLHSERLCTDGLKNCTDLWLKFSMAFRDRPPCNVTADLYTDFIKTANHAIAGKQLFYSGAYELAQQYSSIGNRYTTVEKTLIGYLIDRLGFCGGTAGNSPSVSCESWDPVTCPYTASGSFWQIVSENFAGNAAGDVYALLNATRNPIFKSNSYFAKFELPNLRSGMVTNLTAILINDSPTTKRDPCNTDDSLKSLKNIVKAKNIEFVCRENPGDLVYLFCVDNASTDLCKNVTIYQSGNIVIP